MAGYFNTPGLLHEKLGKFGIVRLLNFIRELPQEGFRYFEAEKYMVREEIMIALAYISENRGNPDISLKNVTERVHMSQSRFCALFKETTGRGFLNYLNRMRVAWAESELRLTDKSLKEIAEGSGFASVAHMSRNFQLQYGFSPTEFRKLLESGENPFAAGGEEPYQS